MYRNQIELEVRVHGNPAREYVDREGVTWVEGRRGSEYILRVINQTYGRVLVVASVDGLSVMDGKAASLHSDQGYIIGARASMAIPGWRLDNNSVAKFKFGGPESSYAAASGQPMDIGVIGCAVFLEQYVPPPPPVWPEPTCVLRGMSLDSGSCKKGIIGAAGPCGSRGAAGPVFAASCFNTSTGAPMVTECAAPSLGTEFGERTGHRVTEVTFVRQEPAHEVLSIRYGTREELIRRGIDLNQRPEVGRPNPFPADKGCAPPPGWSGR
jgi:hypothetical protein